MKARRSTETSGAAYPMSQRHVPPEVNRCSSYFLLACGAGRNIQAWIKRRINEYDSKLNVIHCNLMNQRTVIDTCL